MSTGRKKPGPPPDGKRSSDEHVKKAFYIRRDQHLALKAAKYHSVEIHGRDRSEIIVRLLDQAGYYGGENAPILTREAPNGKTNGRATASESDEILRRLEEHAVSMAELLKDAGR